MWNWTDSRAVSNTAPQAFPPSSFTLQLGFTLLEVMVAIAILAITLSALFGSQAQSLSLAEEVQFNIQAGTLAKAKLSEYESGLTSPENADGEFGEEFPGYIWKAEVQEADIEGLPALADLQEPLQRVDLTVSRDDGRLSFSLRCYTRKERKP